MMGWHIQQVSHGLIYRGTAWGLTSWAVGMVHAAVLMIEISLEFLKTRRKGGLSKQWRLLVESGSAYLDYTS